MSPKCFVHSPTLNPGALLLLTLILFFVFVFVNPLHHPRSCRLSWFHMIRMYPTSLTWQHNAYCDSCLPSQCNSTQRTLIQWIQMHSRTQCNAVQYKGTQCSNSPHSQPLQFCFLPPPTSPVWGWCLKCGLPIGDCQIFNIMLFNRIVLCNLICVYNCTSIVSWCNCIILCNCCECGGGPGWLWVSSTLQFHHFSSHFSFALSWLFYYFCCPVSFSAHLPSLSGQRWHSVQCRWQPVQRW